MTAPDLREEDAIAVAANEVFDSELVLEAISQLNTQGMTIDERRDLAIRTALAQRRKNKATVALHRLLVAEPS